MRVHILGICGTFMAGVARLAKALGHEVEGSDAAAYPPMSDQLRDDGIAVYTGYRAEYLDPAPDMVVVGNALSRGNPAVEHVLDRGLAYTSGPAWLADAVLRGREVVAISGTHGKTTTASMLTWILTRAGRSPGFLIGGVPLGIGESARLGEPDGGTFVVEADEYDTAFFDKRSKFVHYRPRIAVVTNVEFDHADIFDDIRDIRRQFHHLVRTVPGNGRLIVPAGDEEVQAVLEMGCWTPLETFGDDEVHPPGDWCLRLLDAAAQRFEVLHGAAVAGTVDWGLVGRHNGRNALAAIAAAHAVGVDVDAACNALADFPGVRRRLEVRGEIAGVTVYDDFAHHPTAIAATLEALRARIGSARLIAIVDPASNTMRMGVHRHTLAPALAAADSAWLFAPERIEWDPREVAAGAPVPTRVAGSVDRIVRECAAAAAPGDHIVIMSNGAFGGIHDSLLAALAGRDPPP